MRRPLNHRWSNERRPAAAPQLLRDVGGTENLSPRRRAELLAELAAELESRDPWTHGHSRRVAQYAAMTAEQMELPEHLVRIIRAAAELHDVGKMNTPWAVLHKPGRLTEVEIGLLELHPGEGAEIVSTLGDPELTAMVRHHHERLDGTGYPDGLQGDEIPLGARIIAVADTFDAITSTRPYRPAKTHRRALEILEHEAGSRLDPLVVDAFLHCHDARLPLPLWHPQRNAVTQLAV